jgi:hypothetical protein
MGVSSSVPEKFCPRKVLSPKSSAEIKEFVINRGLSAQFIDVPEARQWRETVAKREAAIPKPVPESQPTFPQELFA